AWANEQTVPTGPGERNRRIVDFARYLRSVFSEGADPEDLRPHVEAWHRAALPRIRTKAFGETWRDFLHAWDSVEKPAGVNLAMVKHMATEDTFSLGLPNANLDPVARLLRAAARVRNAGGVFYMSYRTMGRCVGLSPVAARNLARELVALGHLVIVKCE